MGLRGQMDLRRSGRSLDKTAEVNEESVLSSVASALPSDHLTALLGLYQLTVGLLSLPALNSNLIRPFASLR